MDVRMKCEKPGDIEYTVTITMKAGDWERLRDQMAKADYAWPLSTLKSHISDLLGQARKIYWPQNEANEPVR